MTFHLNTTIKRGSHRLPSDGSCTMEIACLAAGFAWTQVRSADDLPECMSRVLGAYVIRLNDAMPDTERQRLMVFVPRLTVTRGTDEEERARAEYLVMHAAKPAAVAALRSVGLDDAADRVGAAQSLAELTRAARAAGISAAARAAARAAGISVAARAAARAADAVAEWAADAAAAAEWAAESVAARATDVVEWAADAAAAADAGFDWSPYLDALDGALRIGPQAPEIDVALIEERTRVLMTA